MTPMSPRLNPADDAPALSSRQPHHPAPAAFLPALSLALACGFIYALIAGSFRFDFPQTEHAHHLLMADAMLHGQLNIRPEALQHHWDRLCEKVAAELDAGCRLTGQTFTPAQRADIIRRLAENRKITDWAIVPDGVGGQKIYGYWAPLTPALMLLPVALFGPDVSDLLINVLFGSLNVGLFCWLLHRADRLGFCRTTQPCRVALTLVLAFGTPHFWMTCTGESWFAVQIVTLTMLLAAFIAALYAADRPARWLVPGVFFGAAILARNIVILLGLFFLAMMWMSCRNAGQRLIRRFAPCLLAFSLPVALAVCLQGVYNYARFGSAFESGLAIQTLTGGQPRYVEPFSRYGAVSPHYLAHNLKYYFWNCDFPRKSDGRIWIDTEGNSLFLVMPVLLYIFLMARGKPGFNLALLAGALPLAVALQFYFATGYVQFGPRYLLDVMPLLLLLAAAGMCGRITHLSFDLILAGLAINLFGVYRFCDEKFAVIQPRITWWTLPALVILAILARVWVTRARPANPAPAAQTRSSQSARTQTPPRN